MWTMLGAIVLAVGTGFASALVPLVNAEAAITATALISPRPLVLAVAVAIALGQTVGKVVFFEAARRTVQRNRQKGKPDTVHTGWKKRALQLLKGRWQGNAVVLLSASSGLPPLAVVSVAAGGAGGRRTDFIVCCLGGRAVRFLVVAGLCLWVR